MIWLTHLTLALFLNKVLNQQEGNVLRNLRPSMFQMLMGKILHSLVQISMMSKCPWCSNVHEVQMSMMSKCPWCGHSFHIRAQLSHVSNVVTLVTCGHTCHMCHTTKWETNVINADQKAWIVVSLLTDYETRPTYRPARPQVKNPRLREMLLVWAMFG